MIPVSPSRTTSLVPSSPSRLPGPAVTLTSSNTALLNNSTAALIPSVSTVPPRTVRPMIWIKLLSFRLVGTDCAQHPATGLVNIRSADDERCSIDCPHLTTVFNALFRGIVVDQDGTGSTAHFKRGLIVNQK